MSDEIDLMAKLARLKEAVDRAEAATQRAVSGPPPARSHLRVVNSDGTLPEPQAAPARQSSQTGITPSADSATVPRSHGDRLVGLGFGVDAAVDDVMHLEVISTTKVPPAPSSARADGASLIGVRVRACDGRPKHPRTVTTTFRLLQPDRSGRGGHRSSGRS